MNQASPVPSRRGAKGAPRRAIAPSVNPAASDDNNHRRPDKAETPGEIPRLLWRLDDVARALSVDRRTIERLRSAGKFPRADMQIGRIPLWRPATIRDWVTASGGDRP